MSPVLDDRGRLFGKLNLVDLLVLVVVVALLVFAFMRFSGSGGEQATIRTTFAVERIRDVTIAQFDEGVEVRDDTGTLLGTVQDFRVSPFPEAVPDAEGNLHLRDSPVFFDMVVVVEGTGFASASQVRVGSVPLLVGRILIIRGPTFEVTARIRDVDVVG
jgi:hypothetical protein